MKNKLFRSAVILLLNLSLINFIFGCNVYLNDSYYANYASAIKDDADRRGLLLDFVPKSATDIKIQNHTEINDMVLEFSFDPTDSTQLIKSFKKISKKDGKKISLGNKWPWSSINEQSPIDFYRRDSEGNSEFLAVDWSTYRAQYWNY